MHHRTMAAVPVFTSMLVLFLAGATVQCHNTTSTLHQITTGTALPATTVQPAGTTSGSPHSVNIPDLKTGKLKLSSEHSGKTKPKFVKSLQELPYNSSVIQIDQIRRLLPSAKAETPSPEPTAANITSVMSADGCKSFADALLASDAINTYAGDIDGGLSIFCPSDAAFNGFSPKFRNLTVGEKQSLLEYHGVPIYQSMSMLRTSNGEMHTLATDGDSKYDFIVQNDGQDVTIKTSVVTAKIVGTVIDKEPLVIFTVDKVLLPEELFKKAVSTSPAPAPAPEADAPTAEAPKSAKGKKKAKAPPAPVEAPADTPDGGSASQEVADNKNNGVEIKGFRFAAFGLSFLFVTLFM